MINSYAGIDRSTTPFVLPESEPLSLALLGAAYDLGVVNSEQYAAALRRATHPEIDAQRTPLPSPGLGSLSVGRRSVGPWLGRIDGGLSEVPLPPYFREQIACSEMQRGPLSEMRFM